MGVLPGVQHLSKLLHQAVSDGLDSEGQREVEGGALVTSHYVVGFYINGTLFPPMRSKFTESVGNQIGDHMGLAGRGRWSQFFRDCSQIMSAIFWGA